MQNERHRGSGYEQRLVARFQSGEAEALGALFDLHVDQVFTYSRHLLGNRDDAEEVTSEAFLRAFERASTFRGDCPFRGWLFGITRNLCLDRLRQPRLLILESETAALQHDGGLSARRMETTVLVQRALEGLSAEHRLALLLCDVEEWDAREAALAMDRTVAATKSLLYRARRELRTRMTDLLDEEAEEEKFDAM